MSKCIINGKVILHDEIVLKNIYIDDDKIVEISDRSPTNEEIIDAEGYYVSPGFIDVHTHGRGGSDTMYATFKDLNTISKYALKTGVTSFLPTTMTMPIEDTYNAIQCVYENMNKVDGAQILGVHMEGPFLNVKYKGAQPAQCMIAPTVDNYNKLTGEYQSIVRKMTLAPEIDNSIEFIKYITQKNVVISLGHTDATYEQAAAAFEAGATSGTHTYNAMTPLTHRAPGVVGAIMNHDNVYAELILDGIHVSFPAAHVLLKTKGKDKLILITDSMEAAGLENGKYRLGLNDVYVKDGEARLIDGTLAGSVLNMNLAVKNAHEQLGLTMNEAVNLASYNPAKSLGEDLLGEIKVGHYADIIFFDDKINIIKTIIKGKVK